MKDAAKDLIDLGVDLVHKARYVPAEDWQGMGTLLVGISQLLSAMALWEDDDAASGDVHVSADAYTADEIAEMEDREAQEL